jgi:hypothetical protein
LGHGGGVPPGRRTDQGGGGGLTGRRVRSRPSTGQAASPTGEPDRFRRNAPIEITYKTPLATQDTITLSLEGDLLAETSTLLEADSELGIPANTVVLKVDYQETRITDDL